MIKEMLIYGSTDVTPRSQLARIDHGSPSDETLDRSEDELIVNADEHASREATEADRERETDAKWFDDSFVDSRSIGSYWAGRRLSPILTRLDLDGRAGLGSPRSRLSSSAIGQPMIADEGGIPEGGVTAVPGGKETEAEQFHAILVPTEASIKAPESHSCTKKQLHRSRTAPAVTVMSDQPQATLSLGTPSPLYTSTSVVWQASIGLILYLAVGMIIYTWRESDFSGTTTYGFIDAIYFCIVTMCTIGYGDITPVTPVAKLFSCAFVLVGFGFIDILLSGMVNFILDRQEALLLSAVTAGPNDTAKTYLVDVKKGRMRIRSKVTLAFGVVIMCIGVGTLVMHFLEDLGWLDSFYLSCMSVTTVGYGDHAFTTVAGRLFASVWLLISTLAVARSFLYLAEARIDKRHRLIAKLVLEKEMTVGDLVAADLDNDGCVSKSDFVVYKLKEMGKIEEKDILEICRQFSRLDTDNSGKITLSCLINLHEASAPKK